MDEGDRLDSWKEIAAYLGRSVTTVQRWEQDEALPVRRLPHAKRGSVYAFKSEIDGWRTSRSQLPSGVHDAIGDATASSAPFRRRRWVAASAGVAAAAALALVTGVLYSARLSSETDRGMSVPRPIATDDALESGPSLSPDGRFIVYELKGETRSSLYVKSIDGGPPRLLVAGTSRTMLPKWSPSGRQIAFAAREGRDVYALSIVPAAGGAVRRLTTMAGIGICWHPDERSIGFVDRNSTAEPFTVFSLALDSGDRTRLSAPAGGSFGDTLCDWSPDRRRLAVARYATRYESDLYVIDVDRAGPQKETRMTVDFSGIRGVAWTPDGREVVLGSHNGLWRVDARSGGSHQLAWVGLAGGAASPSFSQPAAPQPARLVYENQLIDVNVWRWSGDVEGPGGLSVLTRVTDSTWWDDLPGLSPDGKKMAFVSNRTGANEIWTANADGAGPRRVTFFDGPLVTTPQWSPDAGRLVFSGQRGGNRDIYSVRTDGSDVQRLTWDPSQEENPSWSRDGRWIYFKSNRSGIPQIWKMPADGGEALAVTKGEGSQAFESFDGKSLYFVRGMSVPGLWKVPVDGGAERLVLPDVRETWWGVAREGIYFVDLRDDTPSAKTMSPLKMLSPATGNVSIVAQLPTAAPANGFSVAADGRSVLWTRRDTLQNDLMVIDRWPLAR